MTTDPQTDRTAVPPTGRAGLRELIAGALSEARRPGLGGMTEADAVAYMADAVMAVLPAPADRAAVLLEAAALIEARQDRLDAEERAKFDWLDHETVLQGAAVRDMAAYLREKADDPSQLAAGTPQPETQATAEPWLTDSARIGRTLIWSWSDIGKGAFREGYRAAQAEARALLGGERSTDQQQPAVTLPGKEA